MTWRAWLTSSLTGQVTQSIRLPGQLRNFWRKAWTSYSLLGTGVDIDEIAFAIESKIGVARRDPIGLGWNDRHDASALERLDQGIGVIGLVGQEGLRFDLFEQRRGLADIGGLSRRERQGDRIAERIDDGMDLRGQSASGSADGLVFAFFFWAPALC